MTPTHPTSTRTLESGTRLGAPVPPSWNVGASSQAAVLWDQPRHLAAQVPAKEQDPALTHGDTGSTNPGPGLGAFLTALMYGE